MSKKLTKRSSPLDDVETLTTGTLRNDEFHPAAPAALRYIFSIPMDELMTWQESFASTALSNNRLSEVCIETLDRLLHQEPCSDRYILGLAWTLKDLREIPDAEAQKYAEANEKNPHKGKGIVEAPSAES